MKLIRRYHKDRTEGKFIFPDGSHCYCLEKPWLNNKAGISCIPESTYLVDRDKLGRHQWFKIREGQIAERTFIEIHPANSVEQLQGCLAPCLELVDGKAKASRKGCEMFLEWFGDNSFYLEIRKYNPFRDGKW